MYICVLGGQILTSVSTIFLLTVETVPIVWYFFLHFITLVKISCV